MDSVIEAHMTATRERMGRMVAAANRHVTLGPAPLAEPLVPFARRTLAPHADPASRPTILGPIATELPRAA
jgi:hypothetical protein